MLIVRDDINNNNQAAKAELTARQAQGGWVDRMVPIVPGDCSELSLPMSFAGPHLRE